MASGAKNTSKSRVIPLTCIEEDDETGNSTRSGAFDELVSSTKLPVPLQVEAATPAFPVVESKDLSSRVDPGSTFGQQKPTNQPTASKSLPSGAKGNPAKIFSADVPRGESLAKFQTASEDAQNDMKAVLCRLFTGVAKSVVFAAALRAPEVLWGPVAAYLGTLNA